MSTFCLVNLSMFIESFAFYDKDQREIMRTGSLALVIKSPTSLSDNTITLLTPVSRHETEPASRKRRRKNTIMAEDRDEQVCRHNCELHVFVRGENQVVVGVAGLQQQNMDSASVDTTPVTVTPRRNSPCCSRWQGHVNKRQVLGIAMLIIVDLIWVGSAGLTRVSDHWLAILQLLSQ